MAANGHMNGGGNDGPQWKLGLVNENKKYLTAETFGYKINASGVSLRKKQVWTLEHAANEEVVYIKSHLGRYLSTDKNGNIKCDHDHRDVDCKFVLVYEGEGQKGRWSFKSQKYGYFFCGSGDSLNCSSKVQYWWMPHLANHPQVNLRNVNRKRYAFINKEDSEIQLMKIIPWGEDCLITVEFRDGLYTVRSCDERYLHSSGELVVDPTPECFYTLEVRAAPAPGVAFKDSEGKFLTGVGSTATMKSRKKEVGKDELFTLEDSHPQVTLVAHNGRCASIKQGVDVTANQDEVTDKETFQMEFDKVEKKWRFQSVEHKYWALGPANGIQCKADNPSQASLFEFEWQESGTIAIKAANGNYVFAKANGSLAATSPAVTDKEKFAICLINRPILVLKGEYGYVGYKSANNSKLECNKSVHDIIYLVHLEGGKYALKGANDKFWTIGGDGSLSADGNGPEPEAFILEFREHSKFAIKTAKGTYLRGEQNGTFTASGKDVATNTLWEY